MKQENDLEERKVKALEDVADSLDSLFWMIFCLVAVIFFK